MPYVDGFIVAVPKKNLEAYRRMAKKAGKVVRAENVRINENGNRRTVNFEVTPLKNPRERCYLILFEEAERTPPPDRRSRGGTALPGAPLDASGKAAP